MLRGFGVCWVGFGVRYLCVEMGVCVIGWKERWGVEEEEKGKEGRKEGSKQERRGHTRTTTPSQLPTPRSSLPHS